MKKTGRTVLLIFLITALIVAGLFFGYAHLAKAKYEAEHAKAMMSGYVMGQEALVNKLAETLKGFDGLDAALIGRLQTAYQDVSKAKAPMKTLTAVIGEIKQAAEQLPALEENSLYRQIMTELETGFEQAETAQVQYETAAAAYRRARGGLWGIVLGPLFGFPPANTYTI